MIFFDCENLTINQQKWKRHYIKLCNRGQQRANTKKRALELFDYVERHHIVPRCMGGLDDDENIVYLTASEHFVAHQLLMKIFPKHYGISQACLLMASNLNEFRLNNKLYEWVRKKAAYNQSIERKGQTKENNERLRKMSETMKGQTKETSERLKKMAHTKAKQMKGQTKENNERVKQSSKSRTGKTKETCPGRASQSKKMKGRTKETCPGRMRATQKLSILTEDQKKK
jgi:hypothetical protein